VPYGAERRASIAPFNTDMMWHRANTSCKLSKIWNYKCLGAPAKKIISYKGLIIFSTKFGRVVTLNPQTGKCISNRIVAKGNDVTITIVDSILIAGLKKGKETLRAFNVNHGNILWKQDVGSVSAELFAEPPFVIVGTEIGWVFLIDTRDGTIVWKRKLRSRIEGINIQQRFKVYTTTNDGTVYCLNIGNGKISWVRKLYGSIFAPPVVNRQRVFVGTNKGRFYCLSTLSGEVLWEKHVPGAIFEGAATGRSSVYFGTTRSLIYSLKISNGAENWSVRLPGIPGSTPALTEGLLFAGTLAKNVVVVETGTGKILTTASCKSRIRTDLLVAGDVIVVGTEKEQVCGFKFK